MITISLCMIVKNEEDTIARCLESVKDLVDEIIIVDTGSSDNTKEIVSNYTDKIIDFRWVDDIAAARNFAFSHAKMDYIFWLDSNEILKDDDRNKFLLLKETLDPSTDAVTMHYNLSFEEKENIVSSLWKNRLVKRINNFQWFGAVHEYLKVWGNIIHSEVSVSHCSSILDSDRNLRFYENQLKRIEQFSPKDLYSFASELHEQKKFYEAIEYYKKFLATKNGLLEDYISACGKLADCFNEIKDYDSELHFILKSFEYDSPRADFCCRLGYRYLHENQPQRALIWYKLATLIEKPTNNSGMFNHAYYTWLPHLQLCVCYSQLGKHALAYAHNEIARQYLPDHPSILHNKRYLEPLLQQSQLAKKAEDWLRIAEQVDQKFKPKVGKEKLNITYVMNHMKICGGVKIVLEYTNYLMKRGHMVNIVCYDPEPSWIKVKANYIQVPPGRRLSDSIPDTDVIITTVWDQMVDCYMVQKAPVIHFEHGDIYIFEFDNYDKNTQDVWKQRWSVPVPILAVSSGLAAQLEKNFKRKPQVLHNALNDKIFYPRFKHQESERPRILFVGPEQWSYKGIPDILAAVELVRKRGYDIEPVWVTQNTPDSAFEGTVYIGPSQDKLGELYRTCDIYVCGSYFESFPLPPLEAMTCGCAVISTRNVGILEYAKQHQNCLLTDIGDPNGLADAIIELINNKEKRAFLVSNGYETAAKFRWENIMERLEKFIYNQVQDWKERT